MISTQNVRPERAPRLLNPGSEWRPRLFFAAFPVALAFGTWGYLRYPEGNEPVTFSNAVYHAAQLFILHAPHFGRGVPWQLEVGRWLAAAFTGIVAFDFARQLLRRERVALRLGRFREHSVVCGLGRRGMTVIENLRRSHVCVVAVEKSPEPETIACLNRLDVPLVTGDATRADVLRSAGLEHAKSLYALCAEDVVNCEIANVAAGIPQRASGRSCYIHITEAELRESLQAAIRPDGPLSNGRLRFLDPFDPEALDLLVHKLPLDHDGITETEQRRAHLVIIGAGRMGRTLAFRAAQLGHFANRSRVRISVLDRKAAMHCAALVFRHPQIDQVVDIESYDLEAASPDARTLLEKWCRNPESLISVVVCFDDESLATDIALRLCPEFDCPNTRAAIRVKTPWGMAAIVGQARPLTCGAVPIRTYCLEEKFGFLAKPDEEPVESFARDIHRAYVELRNQQHREKGGLSAQVSQEPELQPWDDLREDFRESSRLQAAHLFIKLRAIGLETARVEDPRPAADHHLLANLKILAELEHRRWVAERQIAGWRYGSPSDKARKINENMKDWDLLPYDIQKYDLDQIERIPALLKSVNLKAVRRNGSGR